MEERPPEVLWSWRACTRERIQDLFDFCLVTTKSGGRERDPSEDARVTEQVMAAVGLGPHASNRRPVLSDDFFKGPGGEAGPSTDRALGEDQGGPLMQLPYPFTTKGSAQVSSDDEKVPFPPSVPSDEKTSDEKETSGGTTTNEDDDDEMDADEEDAEEERLAAGASEEPSSGRASGSMSSLGHPVSSRYPFQMRRPTRGTSMNSSSSPASRATPRSLQSRISGTTQSTGNRESTDSHSPRSHYTSSDAASAASPSSVMSGAIPMPPRHPNRSRAGTVPIASAPSTPSPVHFPKSRRNRTRADSGITQTFGAPQPGLDLDGEDDDGTDEPEGGDVVGLLSPQSSGLSPRSSFIHRSRTSTASSSHHSGSRSNSHSGSSSGGGRSRVESVRSRAQSFIAAASRSSLELVRPRSHSMVRLEEDYSSGHSRSGSGSGSGENWTFGHPAAWMRGTGNDRRDPPSPVQEEFRRDVQERTRSPPSPVQERRESESREDDAPREQEEYESMAIPVVVRASQSDLSLPVTEAPTVHQEDMPAFGRRFDDDDAYMSSHPDISTAAASFVTAAATIEGATTTDDSVRTVPSYPHMMERQGHGWGPA